MKKIFYLFFIFCIAMYCVARYVDGISHNNKKVQLAVDVIPSTKDVEINTTRQPVSSNKYIEFLHNDFYSLSMSLIESAKSGDPQSQFKLGKVIGYCKTINSLIKGVDSDLLLFISLSSRLAEQNYFQQLYDDKQQCSLFFNNDFALFQDYDTDAASWNELQNYWLGKAYSNGHTAATAELMALSGMTFKSEQQFETVLADIQQKLHDLDPVAIMNVLYMPDLLVGDEYFSAFAYGCKVATKTENCDLAQEKTPEVFERIDILSARLSMFDACYAPYNEKTNLQRTLQETERLFDCVRSPNFDHFIDIISPVNEGVVRPSADLTIKRIRQINSAQIRHSLTANGWKIYEN